MNSSLGSILTDVAGRLDEVRVSLGAVGEGRLDEPIKSQIIAASFILLEAALENAVKGVLEFVIEEINSSKTPVCDLRRSLFALYGYATFDALAARGKMGSLEKRVELMMGIESEDLCILNPKYLPIDGRTIRKRHFDLMWQVFGFSGASLSEPRHQFTLSTAADTRNDVAHGAAKTDEVAKRQPVSDVMKYIDSIESVILHVCETAEHYVNRKDYRRAN